MIYEIEMKSNIQVLIFSTLVAKMKMISHLGAFIAFLHDNIVLNGQPFRNRQTGGGWWGGGTSIFYPNVFPCSILVSIIGGTNRGNINQILIFLGKNNNILHNLNFIEDFFFVVFLSSDLKTSLSSGTGDTPGAHGMHIHGMDKIK